HRTGPRAAEVSSESNWTWPRDNVVVLVNAAELASQLEAAMESGAEPDSLLQERRDGLGGGPDVRFLSATRMGVERRERLDGAAVVTSERWVRADADVSDDPRAAAPGVEVGAAMATIGRL